MKTALIVWVLLSAPLTLFYMGWGLSLVYREAGMGAFLLGCVSMATGGLGLASLLDKHQPPQNQKQGDR